jgi:hypothetical protein
MTGVRNTFCNAQKIVERAKKVLNYVFLAFSLWLLDNFKLVMLVWNLKVLSLQADVCMILTKMGAEEPLYKIVGFFQLCCSQYFLDKDSLLSSNFWTLIKFYKKWSCFWLRKVGTIRQDGHLHLQFVKMSKCIRFFLCICLKKCVQLLSYLCFYALLVAFY